MSEVQSHLARDLVSVSERKDAHGLDHRMERLPITETASVAKIVTAVMKTTIVAKEIGIVTETAGEATGIVTAIASGTEIVARTGTEEAKMTTIANDASDVTSAHLDDTGADPGIEVPDEVAPPPNPANEWLA